MSQKPGPAAADRADLEAWRALASKDLRGEDPDASDAGAAGQLP